VSVTAGGDETRCCVMWLFVRRSVLVMCEAGTEKGRGKNNNKQTTQCDKNNKTIRKTTIKT
jgi:hypothetical protein